MSRLIPDRPPMGEDEFARKFRPGQPANPLADALDRATAGGDGDDPGYLPPARKASGGQYGRPLAPIQPAADAALKAAGGSGRAFGPAYTPPGPEAAARTAMAASPAPATLGGAAVTGGRVADFTRRRTAEAAKPPGSPAPADDFLSKLDALRNPVPVAAGPVGATPPTGPAPTGGHGFDPTQVNPRGLWEVMNTRPEGGGLTPATRRRPAATKPRRRTLARTRTPWRFRKRELSWVPGCVAAAWIDVLGDLLARQRASAAPPIPSA